MTRRSTCGLYSVGICSLIAASQVPAQGVSEWARGDAYPGVDGSVRALTSWDPDGSGPNDPVVVIGGSFEVAGSVIAHHIAAWNPATDEWSTFGGGFDGPVEALCVLPSGELVAGGSFTASDGVAIQGVARWNGQQWSPLGAGITGSVAAMVVTSTGRLVLAGDIQLTGSWPCGNVAEWDGVTVYPLNVGTDGPVFDVVETQPGHVVAVGAFLHADGIPCSRVAEWTGLGWFPLGAGFDDDATTIVALPGGQLVVGGDFLASGATPCPYVARWSAGAWQPFGDFGGAVTGLFVRSNGDVIASGRFESIGSLAVEKLAEHNGVAWNPFFPRPNADVHAMLTLANGDVLVGGDFDAIQDQRVAHLARLHGASVHDVGAGFDDAVFALASAPQAGLYAAGTFTRAGGAASNGLARRVGDAWQGIAGITGNVRALAMLSHDGVLAVGGTVLLDAVGVGAQSSPVAVATLHHGAWQTPGKPLGGVAKALLPLDDGGLIAGGWLKVGVETWAVAQWHGLDWLPVAKVADGSVFALARAANGDVLAGGAFTNLDGVAVARIARWSPAGWSPLGGGVDGTVRCIAVLDDGDVLVGGAFQHAGGVATSNIARFDGASWHAVGAGFDGAVHCLAVLGDGDVLAGGAFTHSGAANVAHVARLRGGTWSAIDDGVDGAVHALAVVGAGEVAIGGAFKKSFDDVQPFVARRVSTAPAQSLDLGPGCAAAGLAASLSVEEPWNDREWRMTATAVPDGALAYAVYGLQPNPRPLATWFASAVPGCHVLIDDEVVVQADGLGAARTSSWHIPDSPAVIGEAFFAQMVVLEFDASGLLAVTSTNAYRLQIGAF